MTSIATPVADTVSDTVAAPIAEAVVGGERSETRKQIRGSSLLFAGRLLSKGLNFAVHVLIVRYLSQTDFGAFAYALSIVHMTETISDFGLHRAINRYVPIYHEQGEYSKVLGTIVMTIATIFGLGTAAVLIVLGLQESLVRTLISDQQAVNLLLILILLTPLEAVDRLLVGLFAVFASARAIFFRRYLLAPVLRLAVVLMLVLGGFDVRFLAAGYVVSGVLGAGICAVLLVRILRENGLIAHFKSHRLEIPWREVLLFTTPLLTTDLVHVMMGVLDVVLLGYFGGTADVAVYRAVGPAAKLNMLVFASFGVLFTPLASRLFARNDHQGINHLYWQSTAWIAVMTYPVFVMTFSLAQPLTVFLYGARYEEAGTILSLLSFGYYVHSVFGFNGTTLTIFRRVRYVVLLNFTVAAFNVIAFLILIPLYGALGAAIGTCAAMVLHTLLKQAGLMFGTGVSVFERSHSRVYAIITLSAVGLLVLQLFTNLPIYVGCVLAAIVFLIVVRTNRELLDISRTFPKMMRMPLVGWLLGK